MIAELMACGAHVNLFVKGRGSLVGAAVSSVIKIGADPQTCHRMNEDMDINAGRLLEGCATLDTVGDEIVDVIAHVEAGARPRSEEMGHQRFILTSKSSESIGATCLSAA